MNQRHPAKWKIQAVIGIDSVLICVETLVVNVVFNLAGIRNNFAKNDFPRAKSPRNMSMSFRLSARPLWMGRFYGAEARWSPFESVCSGRRWFRLRTYKKTTTK